MRKRTVNTPARVAGASQLGLVDRLLPVWIVLAMAAGLTFGRLVPGLDDLLEAVTVASVSLPIALGLMLMMYPVLAAMAGPERSHPTGECWWSHSCSTGSSARP